MCLLIGIPNMAIEDHFGKVGMLENIYFFQGFFER